MKWNNFAFVRMNVTPRHKAKCCSCGEKPEGTRVVLKVADGYYSRFEEYVFCNQKCFRKYMNKSLMDTRKNERHNREYRERIKNIKKALSKKYPDVTPWNWDEIETSHFLGRSTIRTRYGVTEVSNSIIKKRDGSVYRVTNWNMLMFNMQKLEGDFEAIKRGEIVVS